VVRDIAGLATLEDVLEQIVGEIEDEHDSEEDNIIDFSGGRYLLQSFAFWHQNSIA
jgi:magnesium and cobalt transporter